MTSADKVTLFRSMFRGREDVYPRLWTNARTGRKGYAPACANEWVRGVCDKPRVKCGECPNQAFLPLADQVILDHLQGRHVIGVYPLLPDETCWFLAADFDKASWTEDATAFMDTCRAIGVPAAVERSRSGNGAHVWFFFSAPVAAATARKVGCYLITETMTRRHQLSMASYDRLFPNQDTLPRGGFGNLIALVGAGYEPQVYEMSHKRPISAPFKPNRKTPSVPGRPRHLLDQSELAGSAPAGSPIPWPDDLHSTAPTGCVPTRPPRRDAHVETIAGGSC